MRALLMSSSTTYEDGLLGHVIGDLGRLLADTDRLVFVPYALSNWDEYTARMRGALKDICDVRGAHTLSVGECVRESAFFVGGGNTFRLLKALIGTGLLSVIRDAVTQGAIYIGSSAGSAVTGPTIRTTNDMPITEPPSLTAFGLIGFHLNCHYLDPQTGPRTYMAETRDERLRQFLEENDSEVVCLREPAWLELEGTQAVMCGRSGGRLFRRQAEPEELPTGSTSHSLARWCG